MRGLFLGLGLSLQSLVSLAVLVSGGHHVRQHSQFVVGRAFAPRYDNIDVVRIAGIGCRRIAGPAAAPALGPALVSPALDAGQLGTSWRASRGVATHRYKH